MSNSPDKPKRRDDRPVPLFILKLSEASIPIDDYPFSPDEKSLIVDEVAGFFRGQIEALPLRLVWLFHIGMICFRAYVLARYFRGFCSLPLAKRTRAVETWAYGGLPLARQLFRVVSGITLVAFFEIPMVKAALSASGQKEQG